MTARQPWWRGATVYQIYVRSFRDSNGDGVGDLEGARRSLDYLQWLGIDCVWLSPTMPSPNTDWGYDVADYTGVHPELGTLADLDRLVEDARQRDIAVMLDLVPNHTSSAHPWFINALSGKDAEHRGYYVWAPGRAGGAPPNNWIDATGASAWTYDKASGEYFLHNFLKTQPDLNWWDPRVHQEFDDILRFWFDRGIAGFRIDVAHGLYKDAELRDDPPPALTDHPAIRQGKVRADYSAHRPEVHPLYRHWRQIADSYEPQRALLGETWEFDPYRFGDFYGREQPELHMAFNFTFVMATLRAPEMAVVVQETLAALPPGATPVWTASNHDVGRFPTRWCEGNADAVRAVLLLLGTLPGTIVLYYGDELGMADVDVPPAQQLDEMTMGRPDGKTRDRCRTPMPWSTEANAGFTTAAAHPWLPLGDYSTVNVASMQGDPGSVLNFCRRLNILRREGRAGQVATMERLLLDDEVWAFRNGGSITVVNLSSDEVKRRVPEVEGLHVLLATRAELEGGQLQAELALGPWEAVVAAG